MSYRVRIYPDPGERLDEIAAIAIEISIKLQRRVWFVFNGTESAAAPHVTVEEVCRRWADKRPESTRFEGIAGLSVIPAKSASAHD